MSLSTSSIAALTLLTAAAVAFSLPKDEPQARADIARVAPGTFRSVTVVRTGSSRLRVDEEVTLDHDDHLVRAYVRLEEPGDTPTSMWLDRAEQQIVVAHGTEITRSQPPTDAPWVYAPPVTTSRGGVATALGAWVAARAAASGGSLRIIHADHSELVPADQAIVPTEEGTVSILGDDPVDLDARFATTLHLGHLGTTLTRIEESHDRWVLASPVPRTAYF